jgi:hypothetical protein
MQQCIKILLLHIYMMLNIIGRVVGRVDGGRCQAHTVPDNVHHLRV